ncbi:YhgE/Pip domain-containing protein, partial [Nocardia abscessus]|uniref:YhgE/Pip domain-containing protein n=1 Tax=Nocardia abscessus TaxID=120957 RepID=UPI003CC80B0B
MIGKRARWALLAVALVSAGFLGAGISACAGTDRGPTAIALVDVDKGPTGARVVKALQEAGGYEWQAVAESALDTDDYAAVITLPADLTESMGTLADAEPKRAKVTVATHEDADAELVHGAVTAVTHRIGAGGGARPRPPGTPGPGPDLAGALTPPRGAPGGGAAPPGRAERGGQRPDDREVV